MCYSGPRGDLGSIIWPPVSEKLPTPDLKDLTDIGRWHERFELYAFTNDKITAANKTAFYEYLTLIDKEAYNLLVDLAFPDNVKDKSVVDLNRLLVTYLTPTNFEATERAKLHNIIRRGDERLRQFLLRVQQQSAKCNFGNQLKTQELTTPIFSANFFR